MPSVRVKLLTGRSLGQGKAKVYGKFSNEYFQSVAVCELDPEDMETLEVSEGDNVRVATESRSIVLKALTSKQAPHKGIAFIPYGPWANYVITDVRTHGSGMPTFKGLNAEITPAPKERVLALRELVEQISGGG
ncbi:MAG: molybdopterin dinucleotide binding domain-containing protein [Candidatus Geothermarchaeales archaeon]